MEYYEDGRWCDVEDRSRLTKTEGQVWLTLYQVLLDKECQQKYEITHHSKTRLLNVSVCMAWHGMAWHGMAGCSGVECL